MYLTLPQARVLFRGDRLTEARLARGLKKVDVAKENFDATESAASSATLIILVVTALALLISVGLGLVLALSSRLGSS